MVEVAGGSMVNKFICRVRAPVLQTLASLFVLPEMFSVWCVMRLQESGCGSVYRQAVAS